MTRPPTISFLSDYGTADEFVGVVKSVIRQLAPDALVIDVTHEVPRYDVRAGGLTLARAAQYLAPGVVLAVVDPGVGHRPAGGRGRGGRRRIGPGRPGQRPAGPGGGHGRRGHPGRRAHQPPSTASRPRAPPSTGATCSRRPPPTSAPACPSRSSVPRSTRSRCCPGILPLSREEDGGIAAEVLWVDRFGNAQLNVDPGRARAASATGSGWSSASRPGAARRVRAFADAGPGEVGLIVDSYGLRRGRRSTGARRPRSSASTPAARCGSSPSPTTAPAPSAAPPSSAPSDSSSRPGADP